MTNPSEPSTLINPFASPPIDGGAGAMWLIIAVVSGALTLAIVVWLVWRLWPRRSPRELALAALAARLRLRKRERRVLRDLASAHGQATPAALMLCPSALAAAIDRAAGAIDDAALQRLRDRLSFTPGA